MPFETLNILRLLDIYKYECHQQILSSFGYDLSIKCHANLIAWSKYSKMLFTVDKCEAVRMRYSNETFITEKMSINCNCSSNFKTVID